MNFPSVIRSSGKARTQAHCVNYGDVTHAKRVQAKDRTESPVPGLLIFPARDSMFPGQCDCDVLARRLHGRTRDALTDTKGLSVLNASKYLTKNESLKPQCLARSMLHLSSTKLRHHRINKKLSRTAEPYRSRFAVFTLGIDLHSNRCYHTDHFWGRHCVLGDHLRVLKVAVLCKKSQTQHGLLKIHLKMLAKNS